MKQKLLNRMEELVNYNTNIHNKVYSKIPFLSSISLFKINLEMRLCKFLKGKK